MLRTKLFKGFAAIVLVFAILSALFVLRIIKQRMLNEAQNKVCFDLSGAWSVFNGRTDKINTVITLLEGKQEVIKSCREENWDDVNLRKRLENIRRRCDLDFLGVVSTDGTTVFRSTPPFNAGDSRVHDSAIARALTGERVSGIVIWSNEELKREGDGFAERAFFELEDTPHSRTISKKTEDRGMVMISAAPIRDHAGISGVVYGGVLVNRNLELADKMHNIIYGSETYKNIPIGTTTIFLDDSRISTTVLRPNGNRALGTRVSKEVADQVLDNGKSWIGEALVVNNWYLSAYDPIKDLEGKVVGMLYVGILRHPFMDYGRKIMIQYIGLCVFALFISLVTAFFLANRLSRPIHRLVSAATHMSDGKGAIHVSADSSCDETAKLISAFNDMSKTLVERENSLLSTNHSYMETLGFVAHELKSPVSSVMNYLYLMRQHKLGPLTEKQEKAMLICEKNVTHLVEMIRHYLNLSRIENKELSPVMSNIIINEEIITPLLDALESNIAEKKLIMKNQIEEKTKIHADINMTREVFDNIVGNAVKYCENGGAITLKAERYDEMTEFTVNNTGPSIPTEQQEKLFQKFFRASATSHSQKGTGLGLFITKNIIEAHGGTILAESNEKNGTTIRFTMRNATA